MSKATRYDTDAIPDELKQRDQWVCWAEQRRGDQLTKVPIDPQTGSGAKSDDMTTWSDYQTAAAHADAKGMGIGFMFSSADPYVAIDLDDCLTDDNGPADWLPDMQPFIETDCIIERSPSGDGLHVILRDASIPEWWTNQHGDDDGREVAVFEDTRYFTVTGDLLDCSATATSPYHGLSEWLLDAWQVFNDDLPRVATDTDDGDDDVDIDCYDLLSRAAYPEGGRREHPVHGSATGSNFMVDADAETFRCWRHGCTGNALHLLGMQEGIIECGEWSRHDLTSDTWSEIFAAGRDRGIIAERDTSESTEPRQPEPEPPADDVEVQFRPATVEVWAGLGEDDGLGDLNDREKAATVWELIKQSDQYYVRVRRDTGTLWAFHDGIWQPNGERTLRHAARQALGGMHYGANVLTELEAQARADPEREVDADEFGLNTGTLAVENGLVYLDEAADGDADNAVRDLRPDDYALTRLPVAYDAGAEYDRWHGLVEEWAEDGHADALQEFVGYCLHVGAMPIHRALLLVGSGANGKGTFLSVVRELLGTDNTSSVELQTLANEKDALADFYGSLANIDDDLSDRGLGSGLGMFKKLVGGDQVRARRLYEDGFEFQATGKHLYAANQVPDVSVGDEDEAFWRRWLLVEFPNHYAPSERDPGLADELTQPDVLSGVLNWAIDGWARLLSQGKFTGEETDAHAKRQRWQQWGETMDEFISNHVSIDDEADNVTSRTVHRRFRKWCREEGKDMENDEQQTLTKKLKAAGAEYGSVYVDGRQERGFSNLSLSEEVPELTTRRPEGADVEDTDQERLG